MFSLKNQAEICRIGLITGLFKKSDVIIWADKIIETQENPEYEIIEISLLGSSSDTEVALKLSEINGIPNEGLIINSFFGLCLNFYNRNKFTADEICTFLYRLISEKIGVPVNSDIVQEILYLTDGYSLAAEGIYGNVEDICKDLKEFLGQYMDYAQKLNF